MMDSLRVQALTGPLLHDYLHALAQLRIEVFREFPYLYDGDLDYEAKYLQTYARSPDSVVIAVFDGDAVVGASTAVPLSHETAEFTQPFEGRGYDPGRVFYLGESVLKREYRGRGLGVRFFQEREAHARRSGHYTTAAFCAVERPADHPRRPAGYVPLDGFWANRGYRKDLALRTFYHWRDLGEARESPKPMVFWLKALEPAGDPRV